MNLTGWGYPQIGWLLEEVRKAGGTIPSRYDDTPEARDNAYEARLSLESNIRWAFAWASLHLAVTSDAKARKAAKNICSLMKRTGEILQMLDDESDDGLVLRSNLAARLVTDPDTGMGLHQIGEGLRRLQNVARSLAPEIDGTAPLRGLGKTAQELLFNRLAKAYREGLDADPAEGSTTSNHDPRGPFVAFIVAAHQLAGERPPKKTALETALAVARKHSLSGED